MSEYQYYEFLTIDQPLNDDDISALRRISSRAKITPTTLINSYNFGSFKGDPEILLEKYFDAHIYWANWASCNFAIRIPRTMLTRGEIDAYLVDDCLTANVTPRYWVLQWSFGVEDYDEYHYDRFAGDDGTDWMVRLLPLREELMQGDFRSLYIGWLAAVSAGFDDGGYEPPVPDGLQTLTAAQQSLVNFLGVDIDLMSAAAQQSHVIDESPNNPALDDWLNEIPRSQITPWLHLILSGETKTVAADLRQRYKHFQSITAQPNNNTKAFRLIEQLWRQSKDATIDRKALKKAESRRTR